MNWSDDERAIRAMEKLLAERRLFDGALRHPGARAKAWAAAMGAHGADAVDEFQARLESESKQSNRPGCNAWHCGGAYQRG